MPVKEGRDANSYIKGKRHIPFWSWPLPIWASVAGDLAAVRANARRREPAGGLKAGWEASDKRCSVLTRLSGCTGATFSWLGEISSVLENVWE